MIIQTIKRLFHLFVLCAAVCRAHATIGISLQMQLGNPSNATADTNNHAHFLIQRTVEAIDYSDALGEPNWASWDLTTNDIGTNARSSFITDTTLPSDFNPVHPDDYTGSGYDRGHMCPSKDRTDTAADNDLVFYMSNIVPQDSINNEGVWAQFENYCRSLAQTNELLIICGPGGFSGARINTNGPVSIPDYVWKIAVVVPLGGGTALSRITNSTRVIALKIPNTDAATNAWPSYVTSASQIEADTGYTFFTALPADVASALRDKVDGETNPPPVISGFSPTNGADNASVVITGTNFGSVLEVTFDAVSATFSVDSGTQITAIVPTNAGSGFISVTTPDGTAISSNSFTVIGDGVYTGPIIGWDMSGLPGGLNNYGASPLTPTTTAPNVSVVGLTRGGGVGTSGTAAAQGWGGTGFTNINAATAIASNKFATFGVTANAGYRVSFSSVSRFDYRRSASGAADGVLQYQVGSGAFADITNLNFSSTSAGGASIGAIDLSGFAALQNVGAGTNVTFRIVNDGGTSASGTWYVFDTAGSTALDLAVQGTVTPSGVTGAPGLSLTFSGANAILTWPSSATGFTLQTNGDLATTNWANYGGTASSNSTTMSVTNSAPTGNMFYRLFHP